VIHSLLLANGRVRPSTDLFLSPGQVGVLNGWGVFSTIKVVEGVLFAFHRHWARMRRDAELLRVPFPWEPDEMESMLLDLVAANGALNSTLRVAVIRNRGNLWEGPGVERDSDLIAFTAERSQWGSAVRLGIVPQARHAANVFAGTKVLSWAMNLVWYEEAHLRGQDEVILLNERNEVSECTSANIFVVSGGEALTPPLSSGCLPGVTRELLLEEIRVPGVRVLEAVLTLDDLERADGLFITSSTRDLLPVSSVEGLANRQESRVRTRLAEAFSAYEAEYVRAAPRRAPGAGMRL
jgi:branched-chain amino acid aminotransferase